MPLSFLETWFPDRVLLSSRYHFSRPASRRQLKGLATGRRGVFQQILSVSSETCGATHAPAHRETKALKCFDAL